MPGPKLRLAIPSSPSRASPSDTGLFFASSIEPRTSTDWIELLKACSVPVAVTVTSSRTPVSSNLKSTVASPLAEIGCANDVRNAIEMRHHVVLARWQVLNS